MKIWPPIVQRALSDRVTDVGQLTQPERRALNYWTKRGVLMRVDAIDWFAKPTWIADISLWKRNHENA